MSVEHRLLGCEAIEWLDREYPGFVRVRLVDVDGREWLLDDKVPIFDEDFGPDAEMPIPVQVPCTIVEELADGVVVVETDGRPEAHDGTRRFRVRRAHVVRASQ